eukprot:CAMPEP_0117005316 /NCGR_PEP_ID=MMETSP0472-20121206/5980_1 /TAXON_ID=693140 ORGANISM="Tiarina fusus, Strain LIS" /NCGR_SAMPLE_ID=MMETSP0472 /ASSEMBLY_ACC=CAM_ASM_000603 /LENGTH=450 /DNA_ID=CAMNT_0004706531 /DNA_START=150 /DNA_END=1502 /DNA_ORIENTATION=+
MTVDVDAVNERLNGLVNLLHVVGIDGVDPDALVEEQKRLSAQKGGDGGQASKGQSSDTQILEIIKKLQQAQADSPEILAALKSPELRALASLAAQKQAAKPPEPAKKPAPSLDDVMDDDDNYPKIGPGYSDDISVVSDLTTPTVMTKQQVAEEEFYKDVNGGPGALPPMHIGCGPSQPSRPPVQVGGVGYGAPKQKNLVSQVRPGATRRAIAKTGGAAAQRRLNYQQAMAKLQSSEYGTPVAGKQDKNYMEHFSPKKPPTKFFPTSPTPTPDPSEFPSIAEQGKKSRSTRNKAAVSSKKGKKTALAAQEEEDFDGTAPTTASTSVGSGSRKKGKDKEKGKDKDVAWGGSDSGWPAFGETAQSSGDNVFVDNDGFFSGDAFASGDPFGAPAANAQKGKSPKPEKKMVRDDGQGGGKSRKAKKDNEWANDKSSHKKEKSKKGKSSRRASLSM